MLFLSLSELQGLWVLCRDRCDTPVPHCYLSFISGVPAEMASLNEPIPRKGLVATPPVVRRVASEKELGLY